MGRGPDAINWNARADLEAWRVGTPPGVQLTAVQPDSLVHTDEPVPGFSVVVAVGRRAVPVVGDLQLEETGGDGHVHACARGASVLDRVRQRLLHDTVSDQIQAGR